MGPWALALTLLIAAGGQTTQTATQTNPLEIKIALSKTSALFGEPLWVDVEVTNRSSETLAIDWGTECPDCGTKPLAIQVSDATPGAGEPTRCGGYGGSCVTGAPAGLLPGATGRRQYVLSGDFRITHPGYYLVLIDEKIRWAPVNGGITMNSLEHASEQTLSARESLDVGDPHPAKLLAIEQSLAAEAAEPYRNNPIDVAATRRPTAKQAPSPPRGSARPTPSARWATPLLSRCSND